MSDNPFSSPPCYLHELDTTSGKSVEWARIREQRAAQRERLIRLRNELSNDEQARRSKQIRRQLAAGLNLTSDRVAFYWPLPGEPDLRPFVKALIRRGASAALAVIVRKERPLEFWHWDESTMMETGGIWNIPSPAEREVIVPDVILVPVVGFDEIGHRLGHGGGYYDRTLAMLDPSPLRVGVGYELGRIETIQPQQHDVPMDAIVTELGFAWHSDRHLPLPFNRPR